jgi:hypothetical protein
MASPTGVLRYPYEAITDKTDYFQVTIIKYPGVSDSVISEEGFGRNTNAFDVGQQAASALKPRQLVENGVILLPMPSNIEDSNSVSYDGDSLNSFAAAAFDATKTAMGLDLGKVLSGSGGYSRADVEAITGQLKKLGSDQARSYLVANLAASAVNLFGANVTVNSLLSRTDGKILNPNMELLFNNVTLRTFRFSFKMTPRDEAESYQVKSIIRSFKRNMAARTEKDGLFIHTPNVFELRYRKGNKDHPFLNKFKQCALTDMNVNYTGENVYATYNDGTPIAVIMTLTFKELVPIYQSDYDLESDQQLNYTPEFTNGVRSATSTEGVGY